MNAKEIIGRLVRVSVVGLSLVLLIAGGCDPAWDGPALDQERSAPGVVVAHPDRPVPSDEFQGLSGHVQLIDSLAVSYSISREEGGLDLDGDPDTCAPNVAKYSWAMCDGGVDNSIALVGTAISPVLSYLFDNLLGLGLAFEHRTHDLAGAIAYDLALWPAHAEQLLAPEGHHPYRVALITRDGPEREIAPPWVLQGARVIGRTLTAGRFDSRHRVVLGSADVKDALSIDIYAMQLRATLDYLPDEPGRVMQMRGVLGGALRPHDLHKLIDLALRDGEVVPVTAYQIRALIHHTLPPDIDLDGNGEGDAYSFALEFTATGSELEGLAHSPLPLLLLQD